MKREMELKNKVKLSEITSLKDRINFTDEQNKTFKEFHLEKEFKAD